MQRCNGEAKVCRLTCDMQAPADRVPMDIADLKQRGTDKTTGIHTHVPMEHCIQPAWTCKSISLLCLPFPLCDGFVFPGWPRCTLQISDTSSYLSLVLNPKGRGEGACEELVQEGKRDTRAHGEGIQQVKQNDNGGLVGQNMRHERLGNTLALHQLP